MKKIYESPELDVVRLDEQDIVTASGAGDNWMGWDTAEN